MLVAETITDGDALAALETEWWTLWRSVPGTTPFQSPAWLIPWWAIFAPGRLMTVALRRDGRLVGLAPLYLEDGPFGRRLLPLGIGISDHLDVLLMPGDAEAANALSAAIAGLPDWTSIELEELAPEAAALHLPCPDACRETVGSQSACPVIAVAAETDESGLPLSLPGKRRQTYRRKLRAAQMLGAVEMQEADAESFVDTLATLHGDRWQSLGESGVMADPRVVAFHRSAVPRLMAAGLARLTTTRIAGKWAGAQYWLTWPGRLASYLTGFAPEFSEQSPLTLLLGEGFRHAVTSGAREVSFLRGPEPYKYLWGAEDRWNTRRTWHRT
jgi:CelD/BcsL family acetyltransferase involved in cellulose biosynthesis